MQFGAGVVSVISLPDSMLFPAAAFDIMHTHTHLDTHIQKLPESEQMCLVWKVSNLQIK